MHNIWIYRYIEVVIRVWILSRIVDEKRFFTLRVRVVIDDLERSICERDLKDNTSQHINMYTRSKSIFSQNINGRTWE